MYKKFCNPSRTKKKQKCLRLAKKRKAYSTTKFACALHFQSKFEAESEKIKKKKFQMHLIIEAGSHNKPKMVLKCNV